MVGLRVATLCVFVSIDVCILPRRRAIDFLIFPKGVKTSNRRSTIQGNSTEVQIPALPISTCVTCK